MAYNKFYTKIIENYILDSANDYNYKYHIVITFPNVANTDDYISSIYEYLNNTSFFLFAWHCNTNRKYKKASNHHPRKKHIHMILFTNSEFNFKKYNTTITDIYYLFGVLEYIHDGHHIIKKRYFNIKTFYNFREIFKNLRISDNSL